MHFNSSLKDIDPEVFAQIQNEYKRQYDHIELIASENYTSKAVLDAQGSVLTNKYAEGYPAKRFYGGCEYVDIIENLAIERVTKLFNCKYANVQPHSGSQANQGAFLALINPGDVILGMDLSSGGHLTHGASPNLSGKWFKPVLYGVDPKTYLLDYDNIRQLALKHRPKLIVCGFSAYSREIDFAKFREIADECGAYLLADIAHISGIIAAKKHPSPFPHAHVVTSTTHKTLRGPRGGLILTNDEEIAKKINSAMFPGIQGGPLMHVIAAKAVAFKEALEDSYVDYISEVLKNASALAGRMIKNNYNILTGGTSNHMLLVDLRDKQITGKEAANILGEARLTCNKNSIPFDTTSPFITSGIRLGSPACTTRGFKENEFNIIGDLICELLNSSKQGEDKLNKKIEETKQVIESMLVKFQIY